MLLACLLLGSFSGLLAGLLGIGGGLIIVPALILIFETANFPATTLVHLAIGTSLATIAITSLSSIYAHHQHGAIIWPMVFKLTPGLIFGTLSGAMLVGYIPGDILQIAIGIFALMVAVQMFFHIHVTTSHALPSHSTLLLAGTGIGFISAFVGIGGGTLTVPFLLRRNVHLRKAIAASAACGLPIALAGSAGYIFSGINITTLPEHSIGYIYWPAVLAIITTSIIFVPLGAKLTHQMPVKKLKLLFSLMLFMAAIQLLTG